MARGSTISGTTRVVGVIGDPVAHSQSPAMHNAAFAAAGLDWVYVAWRVAPDVLEAALRGLRALGVGGFNVTLPHKTAVQPFLDELGAEARATGAVNTVSERNGRWRGENTDVEGFLRSLATFGVNPAGRRVVLLGAGGAARAVGYALRRRGVAALHLANRTEERAYRLAEALAGGGTGELSAGGLGGALREALAGADLIVDATSAALAEGKPVPPEWLPPGGLYYFLAYGARVAPFLAELRQRGIRAVSGEEMLLHQGALAFERWTGQAPELEAMRAGLRRAAVDEEESSSGSSK
jgi:shikimate dehydrogenase